MKLVFEPNLPLLIVKYMAGFLSNLFRVVGKKSRKRLKEKAKKIVEKDRVLHNKLAKAS